MIELQHKFYELEGRIYKTIVNVFCIYNFLFLIN